PKYMYQVWKVNLPVRGLSATKDKFDMDGVSGEICGRELIPAIDCSPFAELALNMSRATGEMKKLLEAAIPEHILSYLKGVPLESLVDVLAPHALALFKRSGDIHSSIGATEMPSP